MRLIYLVLLAIISFSSFSYETTGKIDFLSSEVSLGEFVDAKLTIGPINKLVEKDLLKLEGEVFLDNFRLVKLKKLSQNTNNPEFWTLDLSLVVISNFNSRDLKIWSWKGLNIPVNLKDIRISNSQVDNRRVIFGFKRPSDQMTALAVVIYVIVASIIILFLVKRKNQGAVEGKAEKWKMNFASCRSREEIEEIYSNRGEWLELFEKKPPCVEDFFNALNSCQYKKEWSDIEHERVVSTLDQLKDVVKKL